MSDTRGYQRTFGADDARAIRDAMKQDLGPVSYTHLTLPTILLV